jgi:filamentous hemagglutinin family protein
MRKRFVPFLSSLALFSLFAKPGYALPSQPEIVAGAVECRLVDKTTLHVQASDKAILEYSQFDIGRAEKVKFIQPSSQASVLTRVTSGKVSKILGSLESNGKVFLVNPNGIYFGPESQVNVGSLIASTLDIKNQDFLDQSYHFKQKEGVFSSICNEGSLISSTEGSIILLAPQIQNKGIIEAKAGFVFLGSGKEAVIDFTGDGLVHFAVEGEIKEALIEQMGKIDTVNGSVFLKTATAKTLIQEVVNLEGVKEGFTFIEEGGKIFFASESEICSQKMHAEAKDLDVQGKIQAEEEVHLFGQNISLQGALIDASSLANGGEVLIGGEFQGQGDSPYASFVYMDNTSKILANSLEEGSGGIVVLWSKDHTYFKGHVEARGGPKGGRGGTLETSSQGILDVPFSYRDLSASKGEGGVWLLDPDVVNIYNELGYYYYICRNPGCSSKESTHLSCDEGGTISLCNLACGTSSQEVIIQANTTINIGGTFKTTSDQRSSPSITFSPCGSSVTVNLSAGINTQGADITFSPGANVVLQANIAIDTTYNSNTDGANITINEPITSITDANGVPLYGLTLKAAADVRTDGGRIQATGTMAYLEVPGGSQITIPTSLTTYGDVHLGANSGNTMPVIYGTNTSQTFSFITNGGDFASGTIEPSHGGSVFTMNTSSGNITTSTIGSAASDAVLPGNVTLSGANITVGGDGILAAGAVTVSTTTNSGTISIPSIIAQSSGNSPVTINCSQPISIATITASNSPITINTNVSLTSANSYSAGEGNIQIQGNIYGNQDLTLNAGNSGTIGYYNASTQTFSPLTIGYDQTGTSNPLSSLVIVNAKNAYFSNVLINETLTQQAGQGVTSFSGNVSAIQGFSLTGNSFVFDGAPSGSILQASSGGFFVSLTGGASTLTISDDYSCLMGKSFDETKVGGGGEALIGCAIETGMLNTSDCSINFDSSVTITASCLWQTSDVYTAGGDITIASSGVAVSGIEALNLGSFTLKLAAGSQEIIIGELSGSDIINGNVAGETGSELSILQAGSLAMGNASLGLFLAGTDTGATPIGSTLIDGSLSAINGIDVSGGSFTFNGPITSSSGGLSINNTAGLLIALGADITLAQNLVQTGGGSVTIGANITMTQNGSISFSSPITLLSELTPYSIEWNSNGAGGGGGNITTSTIDGAESLTLSAGSGTLTIGVVGGITPLLGFTILGSHELSLENISTNASTGTIYLEPPILLTANTTLIGGGSIEIVSTVSNSSPENFTLEGGAVTLSGALGTSVSGLGIVTITGSSASINSIYTQGDLISINCPITLNANAVISTLGGNVLFSSTINDLVAGAESLTVDTAGGVFTVGTLGGLIPLGNVEITAASNFVLPNITTQDGFIKIHPSIALGSDATLSITSDAAASGAGITLFSTVDGDHTLDLEAGLYGTVTIDGNVGGTTALSSLIINSQNTVTTQALSTQGSGGISIASGASSSINGAITTTGGGGFTLTNFGTISLLGAVTLNGPFLEVGTRLGNVELYNNITMTGSNAEIELDGTVVLKASLTWDATSGNGPVETAAITSPGTPYSLTILAGTGNVTLGPVGASSAGLNTFQVSGGQIGFSSIFTQGAINLSGSSAVLKDSAFIYSNIGSSGANITIASTLDATVEGAESLTINAGTTGVLSVGDIGDTVALGAVTIATAPNLALPNITTANGAIEIDPTVALTANKQLSTVGNGGNTPSGANITFVGSISGSDTLTLNAGTSGDILFEAGIGTPTALGGLVISNAYNVEAESTLAAGSLIQLAGEGTSLFQGALTIGVGGMQLTGTNFDFGAAVTVSAGGVTTLASGNVVFGSLLTVSSGNLAVTAGGSLEFDDTVLVSSGNMTLTNTGDLIIGPSADMTVSGSFTQNGTGRVLTAADLTAASISFTGPIFLTGNVSWTSSGTVLVQNTIDSFFADNLTIAAGSTVSLLGAVGTSTSGIGNLSITGSAAYIQTIYTAGGSISITPPVTLIANATLDTTASSFVFGNNITLSTVDGFFNLTLNPGTNGVIQSGTIGGITPLHNILVLGVQDFDFPSMTTSGGTIELNPPLILEGNRTLNTTALGSLGADISILSTVDTGATLNRDLTLEAGTGNILLAEPIGAFSRIGVLEIVSAGNVNASDLFVTELIQQSGLGTSSFTGVVNALGGGINVQGNAFTFSAPVTAGGSSGITIVNQGLLTFGSSAAISSGNAFSQSGGGSTKTAANITMTGTTATITFADPVVFTADVDWNTTSGNGDVLLGSSVDGPGGLTIDAGSGNITFTGSVGASIPLNSLSLTGLVGLFVGPTVSTQGLQFYDAMIEISQTTTFSNFNTSDITFVSTLDSVTADASSALFFMAGGSLSFLDSVGFAGELASLQAYNAGSFSSADVEAGFMTVSGGIPSITLNGSVTLSASPGLFLDGGLISFGGAVQTDGLFLRARGSITNIGAFVPISVSGPSAVGFLYIDAIGGVVGSFSNPLELLTGKSLLLGASPRADLAGTLSVGVIDYIPGNVPCIVTLNGAIIRDCSTIPVPSVEFYTLPSYWFYLPGIYSSWDNFSNWQYFEAGVEDLETNPRDRTLFWIRPSKAVKIQKNHLITEKPSPERRGSIKKERLVLH